MGPEDFVWLFFADPPTGAVLDATFMTLTSNTLAGDIGVFTS
jgi:hypothetical protein